MGLFLLYQVLVEHILAFDVLDCQSEVHIPICDFSVNSRDFFSLILIIRILFCSLGYFFKVPIIHILSPFLSKLLFCNVEVYMSKNTYRSRETAWRSQSILPLCWFQGSNSGRQVGWKASSADEPSCQP